MRNRTIQTALLSVIPLFLLGALVCRYDNRRWGTERYRFWHDKVTSGADYDLVVIGDSRALSAVSPAILAEHLPGRRILNFAFMAGGLNPEIYHEADRRLAADSPGRIILVGCSPLSLTEDSALNRHLHEVQADWLYTGAPRPIRALASFLEPVQVLEFYHAVRGVRRRFDYDDNGWRPQDRFPITTRYRAPMPTVSPRLRQDLLDAVADWTAKGIAVFVFRPPTTAAGRRQRDLGSGYDESTFKASIAAAGGHWLDTDTRPYACIDGSHLSKAASCELSHDLGRAMAEILGR